MKPLMIEIEKQDLLLAINLVANQSGGDYIFLTIDEWTEGGKPRNSVEVMAVCMMTSCPTWAVICDQEKPLAAYQWGHVVPHTVMLKVQTIRKKLRDSSAKTVHIAVEKTNLKVKAGMVESVIGGLEPTGERDILKASVLNKVKGKLVECTHLIESPYRAFKALRLMSGLPLEMEWNESGLYMTRGWTDKSGRNMDRIRVQLTEDDAWIGHGTGTSPEGFSFKPVDNLAKLGKTVLKKGECSLYMYDRVIELLLKTQRTTKSRKVHFRTVIPMTVTAHDQDQQTLETRPLP